MAKLEKMIGPGYGEDWLMNCPQCEGISNNIHLTSIKIYRCTDATMINDKGIFVQTIEDPSPGRRGVLIEIEYWCEYEHHHGLVTMQFHKGEVLMTHEVLPEIEDVTLVHDIWRD